MARSKLSGGGADELLDGGVARGEQRGGEQVAARGELVAVGTWDFFDHAVGTQQAQLATDAGRQTADFGRRGAALRGIEQGAQGAVAKSGGGEFAVCNDVEECEICGVPGAQGTQAASMVGDRS